MEVLTGNVECSIAIARLAPQDYHRYHSPVEGTVVSIKDIDGELLAHLLLDWLELTPIRGII